MTLRVEFWGTRGSIPSPGPQTVRYGGNTPCLEVRPLGRDASGDPGEGALIILDAGTGIRALGRRLLAAGSAPLDGDIYLTHAHWDHIQGLPFFAPLFRSGHRFRIWAAAALGDRVERAVRAQMAPEVFPVPFEEVRAELEFRALEDGPHGANGTRVTAAPVRHPGGALGFRVSDGNADGRALVYIPDNELSTAAEYETPADWRNRLLEFAGGAELLVHDAMYTAVEQEAHRGWGHSSVDEAVELALDAEVAALVLFHHRPERSDDELDALLAHARGIVRRRTGGGRGVGGGSRLEVTAAAEGTCLTI